MQPASTMPTVSVLLPFIARRVEQILPFAALVQWTHAERLWQGQSMVLDGFGGFSAAAGAGFRVPTGFGVSLMPLKHPYDLVNQARSTAVTTGHSVTLGIGPGDKRFQQMMLGAPYASQIGAVREYATIVRVLLDDGAADVAGEYFRCHAQSAAVPSAPVSLGLGVLRARMAQLAGELADAAITWLTPADHIRVHLQPEIDTGTARSGRSERTRVVAMVPVALDAPGRTASDIVLASNAIHIGAPHYRSMLATAGIAITDDQQQSAANLIDGRAFLYGSIPDVVDGIRDYGLAGVDEVVLNTTGVRAIHGIDAAMSDLRQIVSATASSSPRQEN